MEVPFRKSFLSCCSTQTLRKGWERAKVGLESVDESCNIDLSAMAEGLGVDKKSMDDARKMRNRREQVRGKKIYAAL